MCLSKQDFKESHLYCCEHFLNINCEISSLDPIRAYKKETITLELPGDITIFDIDWFSIYDVESKENYGSVIVPDGLNVPPSLVKIIVSRRHDLICMMSHIILLKPVLNVYLPFQL